MQNYGRLRTTSNFDREYLWNRWRHPKSENKHVESTAIRTAFAEKITPLSRMVAEILRVKHLATPNYP